MSTAKIVGVLNITPDSFSDGGRLITTRSALEQAQVLIKGGADLIDVGAESTRPHAQTLTAEEEWRRLREVLPELLKLNIPISLDSYQHLTMSRALDLGVDMLNDIYAFQSADKRQLIAHYPQVALCVMHCQQTPQTMQLAPHYENVTQDIAHFFRKQVIELTEAGVKAERLCLDPGFGFGKTLDHNWQLLRELHVFTELKLPLYVGLSRKSMFNSISKRSPEQRIYMSCSAALHAVQQGAKFIRTHDAAQMKDTLQVDCLLKSAS